MRHHDSATPRARRRAGGVLRGICLCAAAGAVAFSLSACDRGQQMDPSANVAVLRTTRLVGYPAAQVGADRARAALSLVLPSVSSAADIELAWQSGMAILTATYPASPLYRVVIRTPDRALLSAEAVGDAVRDAVAHDSPATLKDVTTFILLADVVDPGALLPEESVTTTGQVAELDAANRAAGLETTSGPAVANAEALTQAWKQAYLRTHGVPAPTGGAREAVAFAASRIKAALKLRSMDGERALEKDVRELVISGGVASLREWAATTEAVASKVPLASVLGLTAAATREVISSSAVGGLQSGPISAFTRVSSLDVTVAPSATATGFVADTLARYGVSQGERRGLVYASATSANGEAAAAPSAWMAYRAPGGTLYWLAGPDGPVALTDTSLRGWGYLVPSASLVDAADVSRVLAVYSRGN